MGKSRLSQIARRTTAVGIAGVAILGFTYAAIGILDTGSTAHATITNENEAKEGIKGWTPDNIDQGESTWASNQEDINGNPIPNNGYGELGSLQERTSPFLFISGDGQGGGSFYNFHRTELYLSLWIPNTKNLNSYQLNTFDLCNKSDFDRNISYGHANLDFNIDV
ncbi:hypothetical protein [Candidatus Poriferisodalis sp.]|uniref:hypothetical protein n=1 Tax=Candidatus Poriferisodalis sp. TaxID=3101277 RepID=UPI003D1223C3